MSVSNEFVPVNRLTVDGPTEEEWAEVTAGLAPLTLEPFGRLVVVSPHPDDETLGCGGLVATAAESAVPVVVLVVTDGELAGPQKNLAEIRRGELHAAVTALCGLDGVTVHFLERPDGGVAGHLDFVRSAVADVIGPGDLVVCPLIDDGHPDHEAVSRATDIAARTTAARLLTFPVWAWHCHDPKSSRIGRGRRLELGESARRRKRTAIEQYVSQLGGDNPVVPAWMLPRLDRAFEVYVEPDAPAP